MQPDLQLHRVYVNNIEFQMVNNICRDKWEYLGTSNCCPSSVNSGYKVAHFTSNPANSNENGKHPKLDTHCYHSTIPRSAFHWIHDSDDSDPLKILKPSITQVHPMNDRVHLQPFSTITILLLQTLTRLDLLLSFQKPKQK